MRKLIELDAALEGLENLNAISFYEANEHSNEAYTETKDMLKALPTVDAAPVRHGYWIRHDYADIVDGYYVPNYECSVCHAWKQDDSDYCPDCGSILVEESGVV